jgi:hypothetical protein
MSLRRTLALLALLYVLLIALGTCIALRKQPPMPPAPSYLPEVQQP